MAMHKKWMAMAFALILTISALGCGSITAAATSTPASTMMSPAASAASNPEANKATADWTIEFQGAAKKVMTAKDFAGLKSVKLTATMVHMGATVTADYTGVLVTDVLKFAGVKSYKSIKIVASDDYQKEYTPNDLNNDKTIFAVTKNGALLTSDDGPVFLVAGATTGNFWIKHVAKIIVTK
jgi:hypothetical protein